MSKYYFTVGGPYLFQKFSINIYILKIFLIIFVSYFLANRDIGIAPDDANYLFYFQNTKTIFTYSWTEILFEEPIWDSYAYIIGNIFEPEPSLRFTIFITTLIFLFKLLTLSEKAFFASLMFFLLSPEFAIQMFTNQIRQGFALAIFTLFITSNSRYLILGAIISSLIHSSFLFMVPAILLANFMKYSMKLTFALLFVCFFIIYLFPIQIPQIDLGRRSYTYEMKGSLNINYYMLILLQYAPLFYLLYKSSIENKRYFIYRLLLSYFLISLSFTFIHEAGARLMYVTSAIAIILIAVNYSYKNSKIAALYFIFTQFSISVFSSLIIENQDSWYTRWKDILF